MPIKSTIAQVKAVGEADGLQAGQFAAYASVFNNKDSYGDVVMPGAFTDTLAEWKASGAPIPLYWSHLMGADPEMNLGHIVEAVEDEKGLLVTAQLDVDNNPKANYVHQLLKGGRVRQMSFAYDIVEGAPAKSEQNGDYYQLSKLKLHEVSVVPIGANQETEILGVKTSAGNLREAVKAGRVISSKNLDALKSARDSIDAVIVAAESTDDGKASTESHQVKVPATQLVTAELSLLALTES